MVAGLLAPLAEFGTGGTGLPSADGLSPALQFNAACGLPVAAVSGLARGENPLAPVFRAPAVPGTSQGTTDGCCVSRDEGGKRLAAGSRHPGDPYAAATGVIAGWREGAPPGLARGWPPGLSGFIYFMLVLYFIVLSRSDLPWAMVAARAGKRPGLER